MPSPTSFAGTIASRGYGEGPVHLLATAAATYRSTGSAAGETEVLKRAVAAAAAEVAALVATTGADGAAILEFQQAMLEDPVLVEPALARIATGDDAAAAWTAALDAQVADYEDAADEYFRGRAADIGDIRLRVLRILTGSSNGRYPAGAVLCGDDITPSQFLSADWSAGGGIVLRLGSPTSHVAMLARSRGVPMLVGVAALEAPAKVPALIDAEAGSIILWPSDVAVAAARKATAHAGTTQRAATALMGRPATTTDGTPVAVQVNIAGVADLAHVDVAHCDGVGLMRTEFLFVDGLHDEEAQYRAYRDVLEWAAGKPVTIRTVDAGGDKPIPGFTVEETNPFLGLRGIRLALARPELFRPQVRALLRAATTGNLQVMLPMVSVPGELAAARTLFAEEALRLAASGIPHTMPPLGIMVEVPAVAIAPESFANAAFFSIGSNDLTQYVMAAGRDNGSVAALADVANPAVLKLIESVARYGREQAIPVSLCGDAGGDPAAIPLLLRAGLRSLSVAPTQLMATKLAIAATAL